MEHKSLFLILIWIVGISALNQYNEVHVEDGYDPGNCSQTNRGELKLIKDRQDNEKLFFCSNYDNKYIWRSSDGSSTYGEFFNPGFDCSDIINHDANVQDGFYWINLNEIVPKQVWCDMSTDGGGFILIGHKTSPITWTVPSNYTRVDPFTSHQWSSELGNASIMDFRVQVSTSNNFSDTKAHWAFRLNNKRPLKELMILGKGGCDSSSPGIGDIAYVKNLMTQSVVTHNFRCSKFGIAHSAKSKIGWAMMNVCLKKPCKKGFAFYHGVPFKLDDSGAFSYSATGQISGINHAATAFVGCDRSHCCACYGPKHGTRNYCTENCRAINGGTVVKNVNTWFWIRSSLPKRVWRRCMEYQMTANGRRQWFKLIGDNTNPVTGRCAIKEPNLNDGVVVVPDGARFNKLPGIPGILAFRKDTGRLYFKSRYAWRTVAEKRKVSNLQSQINTQSAKISQLQRELQDVRSAQARNVSNLQNQINSKSTQIQKLQNSVKDNLRKTQDIYRLHGARIRLRGGSFSRCGRVEVYISKYGWGTVCDDGWDITDALVVCRQLGYSRATGAYHSAQYGKGSGSILFDDVECKGTEKFLWECPHRGLTVENCSHGEDASVCCV